MKQKFSECKFVQERVCMTHRVGMHCSKDKTRRHLSTCDLIATHIFPRYNILDLIHFCLYVFIGYILIVKLWRIVKTDGFFSLLNLTLWKRQVYVEMMNKYLNHNHIIWKKMLILNLFTYLFHWEWMKNIAYPYNVRKFWME